MQLNDSRDAIAAEVRAAMARKRVTQQQLADEVGMSRVALSDRVRGRRAFDTDELLAVADALDVDFLSFFPAAREAASA